MVNSTQTRLHMKTYTNSECLNKLWYPWVLSVEHHTKLRLLLCVLLCVSFIQLLLPCNHRECPMVLTNSGLASTKVNLCLLVLSPATGGNVHDSG